MFASQLLRILQTLPADATYETCGFGPAEAEAIMKEYQNGILYHPNACRMEADNLDSAAKNSSNSSFSESNENSAFASGSRDEYSRSINLDSPVTATDHAGSTEHESGEAPIKEDQNGSLQHLSGHGGDNNSSLPQLSDDEKMFSSSELEFSAPENDLTNQMENEDVGPTAGSKSASELFDPETKIYTDKTVMECELPELIVCYKETNYHIVKDICIDEGVPAVDKILIESWNSGSAGHVALRSSDDKPSDNPLEKGSDIELLGLETSKASEGERDIKKNEGEGTIEEADDVESFIPDSLMSSETDSPKVSVEDSYLEDLMKIFGPKSSLTTKLDTDVSEKESVVGNILPLQESGARYGYNPFLDPNLVTDEESQPSCQIASDEVFLQGPVGVPIAEGLEQNSIVSNLFYDSKVESSAITFDFNSSKPATESASTSAQNSPEESSESEDSEVQREENAFNSSTANKVQKDVSTIESNKVHTLLSQLKDSSPSEDTSSSNVASIGHRGEGESSFSGAGSGLITYSGPIAYSGSISLRSDSSTTSTRSFAFPILQTEWTASPARIPGDRRHFRKHRGWRQGLLCCRF